MATVITASGLEKRFGGTSALSGLDLSVGEGEIHGYLGPNGAGKTTTLRVLLGMLKADAGDVRVLGGDPWDDAVALHHRIAHVPGDVTLWPELTGGEIIDLLRRLRGDRDGHRRDEYIERFDLDPSKKARTYSTGNRQKVALIAALASDAELLLLDEPTSGFDPLMEGEFRRCVKEKQAQGCTILLSSHMLSEVEALCDRVSIVRDGVVVLAGTLAELGELTSTSVAAQLRQPPDGLEGHPGVQDLRVQGAQVELRVDPAHVGPVLSRLAELGIERISVRPATLEEVFMRQYERRATAGDVADVSDPALRDRR